MTPEQHKLFSAACTAFGDQLAKIFGTEDSPIDRERRAKEIIEKYKKMGWIRAYNPRPDTSYPYVDTPTMERQDDNDALRYQKGRKEWEILEFKEENGAGLIAGSSLSPSQVPHYNIWKVRRLSDNTVWTVGDKFRFDGRTFIIKSFQLQDNKYDLMAMIGDFHGFNVLHIDPCKPVFTTADGVEVKEGDEIYVIAYEVGQITHCRAGDGLDYSFYYSTREAAELAYYNWLSEKPVLTLKDLEFRGLTGKHRDELKQLVKDKIAKP